MLHFSISAQLIGLTAYPNMCGDLFLQTSSVQVAVLHSRKFSALISAHHTRGYHSLFHMVAILLVQSFCVYWYWTLSIQLSASHSTPHSSLVMCQSSNLSNNTFSDHLVGTSTLHWRPLFLSETYVDWVLSRRKLCKLTAYPTMCVCVQFAVLHNKNLFSLPLLALNNSDLSYFEYGL